MDASRLLILALLLGSALLAAGCTTGAPAPVPAPATAPATAAPAPADLASLALTPADLPAGYTLVESRPKNLSELGPLAHDLGWQAGYVVRSANTPPSPGGRPTTIVQSIATYPAGNIPDLVALVEKQDRSDKDLSYTDIGAGIPGDHGAGFFGKASAPILVKPTNENPLVSGPFSHDVETVAKNDVAEAIFSRGTTFEVISMTGPGADAPSVTALAREAYAKIP